MYRNLVPACLSTLKSIEKIHTALPVWLKKKKEGIVLLIHARPGTSHNRVAGEYNGRLKIHLQAPPVEGAANKNLKKFLSKKLNIPKKSIKLLSGHKSRAKSFLLQDISISDVLSKLQ